MVVWLPARQNERMRAKMRKRETFLEREPFFRGFPLAAVCVCARDSPNIAVRRYARPPIARISVSPTVVRSIVVYFSFILKRFVPSTPGAAATGSKNSRETFEIL